MSAPIVEAYNRILLEELDIDWLKFTLVENPLRKKTGQILSKHNFVFRAMINWRRFHSFIIEKFIEDNWDLPRKYRYLLKTKYPVAREIMSRNEVFGNTIRNAVKKYADLFIGHTRSNLDELKTRLYLALNTIIQSENKILHENPAFYSIVFNSISLAKYTVASITERIDSFEKVLDTPITVYREHRSILEQISYLLYLMDAYLNTIYITLETGKEKLAKHELLKDLNRVKEFIDKWYLTTTDQMLYYKLETQGMVLPGAYRLRSIIAKTITDIIPSEIKVSRNKIEKSINPNQLVSLPTILIYSILKKQETSSTGEIPSQAYKILITKPDLPLIRRITSIYLASILSRAIKDKEKVNEALNTVLDEIDELLKKNVGEEILLLPPRPSTLIEYLDMQKENIDIRKIYGEYSFFIHSYPQGLEILRYTSILEYITLSREVERFTDLTKSVLETIMERIKIALWIADEMTRRA